MSGFAFVPRSVQKKPINHVPLSRPSLPSTTSHPPTGQLTTQKNKDGEGRQEDIKFMRELALSVEMAFSTYSLWIDASLRRSLEGGSYIPLLPCLKPHLQTSSSSLPITEATAVQALRTYGSGLLEFRMNIVEPSRHSHQKDLLSNGGYQVRRADWAVSCSAETLNTMTKPKWDAQTVYIENIPIASRSVGGVSRLMTDLLSSPPPAITADSALHATSPPSATVESMSFPTAPHAQHLPQKCKGFAFVILSSVAAAERVILEWPWTRVPVASKGVVDSRATTHNDGGDCTGDHEKHLEREELGKLGFRALSKTSWEALKTEYIARQAHLLDLSAARQHNQDATVPPESRGLKRKRVLEPAPVTVSTDELSSNPISLAPLAAPPCVSSQVQYENFPPNCLLFIRHIHPDTNKTALRTLFSTALSAKDGLDYVDYVKGMDSCHLRVITPAHAASLVRHFSETRAVQEHGNDDIGRLVDGAGAQRPIDVELVTGRREELYWERLPEKVRLLALHKALDAQGLGVKEDDGRGRGTSMVGRGQTKKRRNQ